MLGDLPHSSFLRAYSSELTTPSKLWRRNRYFCWLKCNEYNLIRFHLGPIISMKISSAFHFFPQNSLLMKNMWREYELTSYISFFFIKINLTFHRFRFGFPKKKIEYFAYIFILCNWIVSFTRWYVASHVAWALRIPIRAYFQPNCEDSGADSICLEMKQNAGSQPELSKWYMCWSTIICNDNNDTCRSY